MALVSHKTVKYPEILSAVRGKVTNGASTVVSGRTRIPIASANTFGVTTSWYYYNSASAPGYQVTAVTSTYIEVAGTPTALTTGKAVIFGLPTTVTAGMSSFYLRLGANIYADDPIFFSKESASEGYKVQSVQNNTTAAVTINPAIATGSQAIGSTLVYIGGIAVNVNDTIGLPDAATATRKYPRGTQNSFTFSDTASASRRIPTAVSDSFSLGQKINTIQQVRTTDTFSLADSTTGRARKQNVNISDNFSFGDANRRNLVVNLSDRWLFSDTAILPNLGFTTPEVKVVPPFLPETTGQSKMLFRHYANRERHVNVYMLLDGTFVQDYPSPENGNTNIPYPWNPSDPTAPYATVTNWDGTIQRYYLPNPIVRVFYGGETTMVTQDLANQLRRAGYGNYIRTV